MPDIKLTEADGEGNPSPINKALHEDLLAQDYEHGRCYDEPGNLLTEVYAKPGHIVVIISSKPDEDYLNWCKFDVDDDKEDGQKLKVAVEQVNPDPRPFNLAFHKHAIALGYKYERDDQEELDGDGIFQSWDRYESPDGDEIVHIYDNGYAYFE